MSSRARKAAKAAATTTQGTPASTESGAPVVAGAPSAPNSPEQPKLPGIDDEPSPAEGSVFVAHGRSVTTRSRGIVSAGDAVTADDFASGEDRIEQLVEAGYLVRS